MGDPLEEAMELELSKGQSSTVPEDTMAGLSLLKDWATGTNPTREGLKEAANSGLSSIASRKADLMGRLSSGMQLTTSQAVGLATLALGLTAAGLAAKGKRGVAAAGRAFGVGGKVFLDQVEDNRKISDRNTIAQLNNVYAQEKDLTKLAVDNAMAPLKDEETIKQKVESRRRMVKEGLVNPNGNQPKVIIPDARARERLEGAQEAVAQLDDLEKELSRKFPAQMKKGESWLEAGARMAGGTLASEGDQKELNASLQGIVRANAKSLGANPSNQDVQRIMDEITGGKIYSIPFLAKRLSTMRAQAKRRGEIILKTGKALNEGGGYNTDPGELFGRESQSPTQAPTRSATPHSQNGKEGVVIDGVFHPFED